MKNIVVWDICEQRIYGYPGETNHKILWVENYRLKNG
jgi:hypothetical protein